MTLPRGTWLTPAAPAALGILALSGQPPEIFDRSWPKIGNHRFGRLRSPDGQTVDEIVALRFADDSLWLCTHGGPGIRAAVSELLQQLGWQITANPTNLSTRDELRIKDVLATASSPAATQWLLNHIQQNPEATVPETPFNMDFLTRRPRILLTGPANAGKSALLNAWCGYGRAVVSAIPGTTRDLVAALVDCHGWFCEVFDSAGLRHTNDELEAAGQDLAQAARSWVDIVVYVHPADNDDQPAAAAGDLVILGKADLLKSADQTTNNAATMHHDVRWQAPFAGDATASNDALMRLNTIVCQALELPPGRSAVHFD